MLLNPLNPDEEIESVEPEVLETKVTEKGLRNVLSAVGLVQGETEEETDPENHVQSLLKRHNADLESAAKQLGTLLVAADNDNTKLRAVELVMKLNKLLDKDSETEGNGRPQFNITIVGSQNKNILNVLLPSHRV